MKKISITLLLLASVLASCDHINNKEVPNFMVRLDLGTYALWNTYGVSGVGDYRYFNRDKRLPANFPYNVNTYTGYGGVLLIQGLDAACPVENKMDVVVGIDSENFDAVCPKCHSHYDVLMGGGGPKSGQAYTLKYGLRQLKVYTSPNGGYTISNN